MANVGNWLAFPNWNSRTRGSTTPRATFAGAYRADAYIGADEALAALEHYDKAHPSTCFQTLPWLTVLYEELAPGLRATPRVIVVREVASGDVAIILPLVVFREGILRVAEFADLGVSDYGAAIMGPAAPDSAAKRRKVWRAIRRALPDVDLIRLLRMPLLIGRSDNPLLSRSKTPARHSGHHVEISDTVDELLRSRGKKYRKEVERCTRVWQKETPFAFCRAESADDIARAFSTLEEQQAARHAGDGRGRYVLKSSPYRAFHERLVMDASAIGFSHIFTLEARGKIAATLFGTVFDGSFTLLRISHGGEEFSHFSPGRLIVVEAMRYFHERGVRRFDMGVGDYRFKRDFGALAIPLVDVVKAQSLAAFPRSVLHRFKARLRHSRLRRAATLEK